MRSNSPSTTSASEPLPRSDWTTLTKLFPYLWQYKWRVIAALCFMVAAKLANIGVPLLLKKLVDGLTLSPTQTILIVPLSLLLAYGALRLCTTVFSELRELVFAKATEGASRSISLQVFRHLHALSLRFHLERQTGGMTRDIERGTRGVHSLISYSLYSIVPTLIEVTLVLTLLAVKFDAWFAWITLCALAVYIAFTVTVTEWRTHFRKQMNELDSNAHSKAVDALLNYETVKYFNNERFEADRYDRGLESYRKAAVKSQASLSMLNIGQQLIIACALVCMLWRAASGVAEGRMTLGDFVMVNAFMIQLYIPLNFLGVIYREIKQGLTDLDKLFSLLDKPLEITDSPAAKSMTLDGPPSIEFHDVDFGYTSDRPILQGLQFSIPAGKTVAVVGPSGSGKSTLARLLFRFYDVQGGAIKVNGIDIRELQQDSLRKNIGIVPQDTVLFNDSIEYNIRYGDTGATTAQVENAAKSARIHEFIISQPLGYASPVGERGLKLSGGEKQRVAIARTLLKNPQVLIFDEATSALDSANERAIQLEIASAAQGKTTLVIAHRLSTVVDAYQILVLQSGKIVERGTHAELLALAGQYAQMWAVQRTQQPQSTSKAPTNHGNQVA